MGYTPNSINHISTLNKLNYEISAFLDDRIEMATKISDFKIIDYEQLPYFYKDHHFFISIGDNFLRYKYIDKVKNIISDAHFPTICHPTAIIADETSVGEGTIIGPFCYVGNECSLNEFNILKPYTYISHNISIGSYNFFGSRTSLLGGVTIGSYSSIFANSVISRNISIADNSIIGINSYLRLNTSPNCLYFGSPAKFIRKLTKNESLISQT